VRCIIHTCRLCQPQNWTFNIANENYLSNCIKWGSDSIRLAPIGSDGSGIQLGIYSHTEKKQHKNVINYYAEVSSIIIKLLFQILVRSVLSSYAASQLNIDVTQVTRLFNISSGIKTTPLQFHICMI